MEAAVIGYRCQLLRPVRDKDGHTHFRERPTILREVNLDRRMWLIRFDDGATTFVFPDENEAAIDG